MEIYFIFIFGILVVASLLMGMKNLRKRKKILILFFCIGVVCIQGFRNVSVGVDLESYIPMFHSAKYYNLFLGETMVNYEFGYSFYSQIFSYIGIHENIYLGIVSATIIIPIGIIIYKFSELPLLSIISYISLGFFTFSFSGLRQAIALGITFLSYKYIVNRKFKKFIFMMIIACSFHKTAIVFVLAYFLYGLKIKTKNMIFIFIIFLVTFILRGKIYGVIHLIWNGSKIQGTDTGAYTMLIVMLIVMIVALILRPRNDEVINSTINYMLVAIFIQIFASQSSIIMRAGYYYYIFIMILIPNIISYQKNKMVKVLGSNIYILLLLVFYYLTTKNGYLNVVPYRFL